METSDSFTVMDVKTKFGLKKLSKRTHTTSSIYLSTTMVIVVVVAIGTIYLCRKNGICGGNKPLVIMNKPTPAVRMSALAQRDDGPTVGTERLTWDDEDVEMSSIKNNLQRQH